MNIESFRGQAESIQHQLMAIRTEIEKKKSFSNFYRAYFNETLDDVIHLIDIDNYYLEKKSNKYQLATQIVKLIKIGKHVNAIRDKIYPLTGRYHFHKKINALILPLLDRKISRLAGRLISTRHLPFNSNKAWEEYRKKSIQILTFENEDEHLSETIQSVQKEFFHWLGERLDQKELKVVDLTKYESNYELQSSLSYLQVLEEWMKKGEEDAKSLQNQRELLKCLKEAHPTALKITFICHMSHLDQSFESEYNYFKALAAIDEGASKTSYKKQFEKKSFFEKYKLSLDCSIPLTVLVNDICWDVKQLIEAIPPGGMSIFNAGVDAHAVLIEIKRLLPTTDFPHGQYQYAIFNTGWGASSFHRMDKRAEGEFFKPYCIKGLRREAFDCHFIEKLIKFLFTKGGAVKDFYQLHESLLLEKSKGELDLESGKWYRAQKFGICSYAAVEAWIDSHLNQEEILQKEWIKSSLALAKQRRVVEILRQEAKALSWSTIFKSSKSKTIAVPSQEGILKQKELKDSLIFLELGNRYKQKIEEEIKHEKNGSLKNSQ